MNLLCHRAACIVVAVAALVGCRKKPAPPDPLAIVHTDDYDEGPCRTGESEPWPAHLYVEPSGASPFGVAARGPMLHPKLVRVGAAWILYDDRLRFFELVADGLRPLPSVAPSSLPTIDTGKKWDVESLAGPAASLVVDLDVRRGYTSPTDARTRLVLTGGAWQVGRPGASANGFVRTLTWADGRVLEVSQDARSWLSPRAPALLDLGVPPADCAKPFSLDDTVIVGDTTYVFGRTCLGSSSDYVARFVGSQREDPVSFIPFKLYQSLHAVSRAGAILVAAEGCPGEKGAREFVQGCYATTDGSGWHRIASPKDPEAAWATINSVPGIPPVSVDYAASGAAWVVLGKSGDFYGASGGSGPAPVGEVHRRVDGGDWERIALPHEAIGDGWVEKRFVAEAVATPGTDVYVSGFWYYTRKPTSERVQIKRRWALLRLDYRGPSVELPSTL